MQPSPDLSQLIKLAQSSAGQQLLSLLQRSGGEALQSAIAKASAGDYREAQKQLSSLLSTPEAQALLKQMEETK